MMTAQMQYDAVREFPEVYRGVMEHVGPARCWRPIDGAFVPDSMSYHTLLGLFAAATGCGVARASEWHRNSGRKEFIACDGNIIKASDDDRLLALVAAYRAGVRA